MKPEPVGIGDITFFIANVMKDCPATTVVRELLQNAIEAADGGRIEWCRFNWKGTEKLCLYNEGRGMSANELKERMKIASSGKKMSFEDNFGQGAKMSGGKASPHGLVYRSCFEGLVFEIWLQLEELSFGRKNFVMVPQYDEIQEEFSLVRQVTDDAVLRGRSLDHDWTEAILLGRSKDDDTTNGAFLGESKTLWLMSLINQRYYRFPRGVVVRNATITSGREKHRNARGMHGSLVESPATDREELVEAEHPFLGKVGIRYGRLSGDQNDRRGGSLAADGIPGGSHVCLVYKDEIYDFDPRWYSRSGAYGFSGACEDFYVHLLIPDGAPLQNNNHRTQLLLKTANSDPMTCERLCDLVRENRPGWVLEDLASRNKNDESERVQDRLRELALRLMARMELPVVQPGLGDDPGLIEVDGGDGSGGNGRSTHREPTDFGRSVVRGHGKRQERPRPDTIRVQFRPKESSLGWYEELEGLAGDYDKGDNTVWLSKDFCEFKRLKAWVDQCWPCSDENAKALAIFYDEYCYYAGKFGIAALLFRGDDNWTLDQWEKCLSRESISAYMRDPGSEIERTIKTRVHRLFNYGTRNQSLECFDAG